MEASSSRKGLIGNFNDYSTQPNKYDSFNSGFTPTTTTAFQDHQQTPKTQELSLTVNEANNLSDQYNPFDTESFKKKKKDIREPVRGTKKKSSAGDSKRDILSSIKRFVTKEEESTGESPVPHTIHSIQDIREAKQQVPFTQFPKSEHPNNTPHSFSENRAEKSNERPRSEAEIPPSNSQDTYSAHSVSGEILTDPEYRNLVDAATRQIRLLSHYKKVENPGVDIPSMVSQSPPSLVRGDEEFDSDWDQEYNAGSAHVSSERDFPTTRKVLKK